MNRTIEFLTDDIPELGEAHEISPGILWIRMPLPFKLNHINLWLIEEQDGWVLIDTGINDDQTKSIWRKIFKKILNGKPINKLICTHAHPDHIGLSGWITKKYKTKLLITREEWAFGRMFAGGFNNDKKSFYDYFARLGCNPKELKEYGEHISTADRFYYNFPNQFERLIDGSKLMIAGNVWEVIVSLGHSIEHASLYCSKLNVLIAGDQILPKITPTIMVHAYEPEANPLREFLTSNEKFRYLPEDVSVLPSHNVPFRGLHMRLDQYIAHHKDRLKTILETCRTPLSALQLAKFLFPQDLDKHGKFFAIGETLAHIRYLEYEGKLHRSQGANGVDHYFAV